MPTPLPLHELPPLSSLKGFEAAARLLSLRAAAIELHLTHPAIVNQIQRLEQSLGVKLFAREGRHVVLTAAGQRFYPVVREALAGLAQGAKVLRQMQHSAPLTVQVYDWQPLFESRLFPVCSPQMLVGKSVPLACDALKTLPLISVYTEGWNWDSYFETVGLGPCPSRNCIVVDTLVVALEMAARGEGVALVNGPFADEDLSVGRLVNPTGQVIAGQGEWGAVCHRKLAQDVRVATLLHWLHIQSEASPSRVLIK